MRLCADTDRQATLFIVERDDALRERLSRSLLELGHPVYGVRSGQGVLRRVKETEDPVLVLNGLAPRDGLAGLRSLVEALPRAPILALLHENDTRTVVEAMRLGACGCLVDPVEDEDLRGAVRQALANRSTAGSQGPAVWRGVLDQLRPEMERIAVTEVPVLVQGETGVGKEVVARQIHATSRRAKRPFVKVHCAALPHSLLESELFGYEKGAFTGANESKPGRFEMAHRGTIFLDEIGEMTPDLQAKLLQVLQDGTFSRLGSYEDRKVDVRVVCATHRDLEAMIEDGTFRADLYYRINVVTFAVPPLRARRDEVRPLLDAFLHRYASLYAKPVPSLDAQLLSVLEHYSFPGNVRELENMAKRLVAFQDSRHLLRELREPASSAREAQETLERIVQELEESAGHVPLLEVGRRAASEAERYAVRRGLDQTGWNRRRTARLLHVSYSTLLQKIRDLELATADETSPAAT